MVALVPVDSSVDAVLVCGLDGVDDSENFSSVTTSGSGVTEDDADLLLRVDDENRADGHGKTYNSSS